MKQMPVRGWAVTPQLSTLPTITIFFRNHQQLYI